MTESDSHTETMADERAPDSLEEARRRIDRADRALFAALGDRLEAVRAIGSIKERDGTALVDPGRESDVSGRWASLAEDAGVNAHAAGRVLAEILHWSRREQESRPERAEVARVAYQGARGANGDLAARRLMGLRRTAATPIGFDTFEAALGALAKGDVDYALLPIENAIVGNIEAANALLLDGRFTIVDEEVWTVTHSLAARPGARLDRIRRVLSHPVALRQCHKTVVESLGLEAVEVWDTAGAAQLVASADDDRQAALCPIEAAGEYGLEVLREDVSDHPENWTRFLLLSRDVESAPAGVPCRTTLRFVADHAAGSLARCLGAFESHGVNLTRLISQVLPSRPGQYGFIVDLDGHADDEPVAKALALVRAASRQVAVLGSYPNRSSSATTPTPRTPPRPQRSQPGPKQTCEATKGSPKKPAAKGLELVSCADTPPDAGRRLAGVPLGGEHFALIAGPCAVESKQQIEDAAAMVASAGAMLLRGGAFKPRTSTYSFQGLGLPGLELLKSAGERHGLPVVTEVLSANDVEAVAARADVLQIGARNMQNFELLRALGSVDRPILLKRGMSATVDEWLHAAEYILAAGNQQVVLCERGIRTFETSTRATLDLAAVAVVKERSHLPVIVDPSHAAGRRELVTPLALAAAAAGADGLIVECHPRPDDALCDKEQALDEADLEALVKGLREVLDGQGRTFG